MQWSIAINTGNTSGLYGNKKKRTSWSSVDNGPLMKGKREKWFMILVLWVLDEDNLCRDPFIQDR